MTDNACYDLTEYDIIESTSKQTILLKDMKAYFTDSSDSFAGDLIEIKKPFMHDIKYNDKYYIICDIIIDPNYRDFKFFVSINFNVFDSEDLQFLGNYCYRTRRFNYCESTLVSLAEKRKLKKYVKIETNCRKTVYLNLKDEIAYYSDSSTAGFLIEVNKSCISDIEYNNKYYIISNIINCPDMNYQHMSMSFLLFDSSDLECIGYYDHAILECIYKVGDLMIEKRKLKTKPSETACNNLPNDVIKTNDGRIFHLFGDKLHLPGDISIFGMLKEVAKNCHTIKYKGGFYTSCISVTDKDKAYSNMYLCNMNILSDCRLLYNENLEVIGQGFLNSDNTTYHFLYNKYLHTVGLDL